MAFAFLHGHVVEDLLVSAADAAAAAVHGQGKAARGGGVVEISSDQKPLEAFMVLAEHNIQSAPVWDHASKSYTGFIDVRDLVSFVVFLDDEKKYESYAAAASVEEHYHVLLHAGARYFKLSSDGFTVTYLSRRNPFRPVRRSTPLIDAVRMLAAPGVHRLPVLDDETGRVCFIASQTAVLAFVHEHIAQWPAAARTVGELGIAHDGVVTCLATTPALEVFRLMDSKKLSGVGIVSAADGSLVGNTSGSDLKLFLQSHSLKSLSRPILEYLAELRALAKVPDTRAPAITVASSQTLAAAVAKLAATKVHRLFVADDADGFVPKSVLACSDILNFIVREIDNTPH